MIFQQIFCFLQFALAITEVSSDNILVLHPVFAGSHVPALRIIIDDLLSKGHWVKVIRWKECSQIPAMVHENVSETILAINNSEGFIPHLTKEQNATIIYSTRSFWKNGLQMSAMAFEGQILTSVAGCEALVGNEALLQELKEKTFKVAIVDLLFNECGLAVAYNMSVPVVGYWAMTFAGYETHHTTAYNTPASIPYFWTSLTDHMTFFERTINFLYYFVNRILMEAFFLQTNYHIQNYMENAPYPSELLVNLSGILIDSNGAFDYPKLLPPTFIEVGGYHIRDPKPLPKDLDNFMEHSNYGVILMSLGRNFDSESLPEETFSSFLNAFRRLKHRVIVKSNKIPDNVPPNVKVMSYLPQSDILAHPKTILFVTHGGMKGVWEAIYHGVKMVVMPIAVDQKNIAARLVDKGVAISLPKTSTEYEIFIAITEVIGDERYEKNTKQMSENYHSSFGKPLERAIWLIELVMKTNGADYLKLSTKDLNFIQYFCIDVILFLTLIFAALGYFVCKILMWILKRFFKKDSFRQYKVKKQ